MLLSPIPQGHAQTSPPDTPTTKMVLKGCRKGCPMQYDHIVIMLDGQSITEESEDISMALGLVLCVYFFCLGSNILKD